jgi:hypothetical protein
MFLKMDEVALETSRIPIMEDRSGKSFLQVVYLGTYGYASSECHSGTESTKLHELALRTRK